MNDKRKRVRKRPRKEKPQVVSKRAYQELLRNLAPELVATQRAISSDAKVGANVRASICQDLLDRAFGRPAVAHEDTTDELNVKRTLTWDKPNRENLPPPEPELMRAPQNATPGTQARAGASVSHIRHV